jgi:hypothetical protein
MQKIRMKKSYILIIFTLLITLRVNGQISTAKYSNEFMSIGVGARSLGMGNASTSVTSDATAGYWNPALLASVPSSYDAVMMHSEQFAGIAKFDYAALAYRPDSGNAMAFSIIRYGVDDIPNTLDLFDDQGNINYDKITSFSAADYAFIFSYARKSPSVKGLQIGGSAKIIRRIIGDFANAWGFGIDAGLKYDYRKWTFAAMARDASSTFNAWSFNTDKLKAVFDSTSNEIPQNSIEVTLPKLIVGCSRSFNLNKKFMATASADVEFTFDGERHTLIGSSAVNIDPRIGAEFSYNNLIFLRAGICNIQKIPDFTGKEEISIQPNMGVGVVIRNFSVDYAYTNLGDPSTTLYSHVFSLRYHFGQIKP